MPYSDRLPGKRKSGAYQAEKRITLAQVPGLRVRQIKLAAGQCVPWHYHSEITDTFFCLTGTMRIRTRNPEAVFILRRGDSVAIRPGRTHFATGVGGQTCEFIVVQGVGNYDYVPVDG